MTPETGPRRRPRRSEYYGLIANGRGYAEVLVTRHDGPPSTDKMPFPRAWGQTPTGKTYSTWDEACADNERKNR